MRARYVLLRDRGPVECSRCGNATADDWWWAPSKQAKFRKLCGACHDRVEAEKSLAVEMYAKGRRNSGKPCWSS